MNKKRVIRNVLLVIGLPAVFVLGIAGFAFAVIPSITANPISGETEATFRVTPGVAPNPAEVKVRIQNTSVKYEVRQEILSPLSTGSHDIDWRYVTMRGLLGTNATGTFHAAASSPQPLLSFNPLYTNTAGSPDEFILIYYVDLPPGTSQGSYRGRLRFVLTPLDSGQSQVYCILTILVNVGASDSGNFIKPTIEIAPLTSLNTITLNSKSHENHTFDVGAKINGKFNAMFSIIEVISQPFVSSEGNQLDLGAVNVQGKEVEKGMGIQTVPLSMHKQVLYTSMPNGEAADAFIINYSLGDLGGKKAGKFKGRIQYYLEQAGSTALLKTLECEVEIERIFDMAITLADMKNSLEFRILKPQDKPQESEVLVEIKSNIGRPYQVTQKIYADLTSKDGQVIPSKYFTLKTENFNTKGGLRFLEKGEVKKGDTVLFVSDAQGSSDSFKIIYALSGAPELMAGYYGTRIVYSLLEI